MSSPLPYTIADLVMEISPNELPVYRMLFCPHPAVCKVCVVLYNGSHSLRSL